MNAMEQTPSVAFLGLGNMGEPMARNLLRAGFRLQAWNRSEPALERLSQEGAQRLAAVQDAAAAPVVMVMLPDLPQIEELLVPLVEAWTVTADADQDESDQDQNPQDQPRTVLVVMSSVSPTGIVRLGKRLAQLSNGRVALVDAPVSGGTEGAAHGTLSIMAGGTEAAFEQARPVLEAMGTPRLLGALGAGSLAKACNQVLVGLTTAALAEAVVVAERAGLDGAQLLEVLGGGLADSAVLRVLGPRLVEQDYAVRGAARYMFKDLGFFLEAAHESGTDALLSGAARARYRSLIDHGYGDQDLSVVRAEVEHAQDSAAQHSAATSEKETDERQH
ncbi:NAD(P)-dependent oxidoreductase [Psychromicrobium xiongbiense]|uniref:NAD(P)-dependent oxidoreductase n=1 Tax=Psychromicrobium xiongbiense TaxID=3051184 RepID=UPI0025533CF2|nr:NAD(P)-dependent oxidoreductase [Psychromicrobium sp. YIM S02556]